MSVNQMLLEWKTSLQSPPLLEGIRTRAVTHPQTHHYVKDHHAFPMLSKVGLESLLEEAITPGGLMELRLRGIHQGLIQERKSR
jgi:hypothetical protein